MSASLAQCFVSLHQQSLVHLFLLCGSLLKLRKLLRLLADLGPDVGLVTFLYSHFRKLLVPLVSLIPL